MIGHVLPMDWHVVNAIGMQMDLLKTLALGMCATLLTCSVFAKQSVITVLAPNNYFPPSLLKQFETEFSATVNVINYNDVRIRDELFESYSEKIDIALIDKQGLLYYIEKNDVANLADLKVTKQRIDEHLQALAPTQSNFARLISYTSFGVLYNQSETTLPKTWSQILNPSSGLIDKVALPGTYNNAMTVALLSLSKTKSDDWHTEISSAGRKLQAARNANPNLFSFAAQDVLSEKIYIAPMKDTAAAPLMKLNPNLTFGYPENLTRVFHEYAFVHSLTQNIDGAVQFMNFITRSDSLHAIELQSGVSSAEKDLTDVQNSDLFDFFISDPANVQFELLKSSVFERVSNEK